MKIIPSKILVIRADRIGDVILSTPVLTEIKKAWPESRLTFLVRPLVAPLVERLRTVDELFVYEPEGRHAGIAGNLLLLQELRARKFDAVVMLQYQPKLALAIRLAGIPIRVGPLSKLGSYLVFNRGKRQRRSKVEKHETEYNLDLLERIGIKPPERVSPQISVDDRSRALVGNWWSSHKMPIGPRIAIHPGMGGSALNWPMSSYQELTRKLLADGISVVITLGPMDQAVRGYFLGTGVRLFDGSLPELAALYESCDGVIAPSTGPLHVASAASPWVIGLYPNIRVQSPKRWGPYTQDPSRVTVFSPSVDCAREPECMKTIPVDDVYQEIKKRLAPARALT